MPAPIWPTPASPVRDPGVDDRQDAGVDHLAHVDPGRRAARSRAPAAVKPACAPSVISRIRPRVGDRVVGRAADELHDRRGRGHREPAEPGGLGDRESPMSGSASAGRVAGKNSPSTAPAGAGEPASPVPLRPGCRSRRRCAPSRSPSASPATPCAASASALHAGHRQVEEEVLVAGRRTAAPRPRRVRPAVSERRRRHVSRLQQQRRGRRRCGCGTSSPMCSTWAISGLMSMRPLRRPRPQGRASTAAIQRSRSITSGAVRAEAQHLAQALVERAVGPLPVLGVLRRSRPASTG